MSSSVSFGLVRYINSVTFVGVLEFQRYGVGKCGMWICVKICYECSRTNFPRVLFSSSLLICTYLILESWNLIVLIRWMWLVEERHFEGRAVRL